MAGGLAPEGMTPEPPKPLQLRNIPLRVPDLEDSIRDSKEYALNRIRDPIMISGILLKQGVLESL